MEILEIPDLRLLSATVETRKTENCARGENVCVNERGVNCAEGGKLKTNVKCDSYKNVVSDVANAVNMVPARCWSSLGGEQ
jgi:hypothetical protein